ncbi:phosphoinositide-3-kinase-interacting protein 1 isoform X2 [Dipodomys merriami]|uniref:phosphoinositide-3-kinase-interacting protein 1 isoform X2 n=1 Tax=Dipodomys merriami TaxID=94247 RepID=UPI003855E23D
MPTDLEAASGTTATCTGRTSPHPRPASSVSTGGMRRSAGPWPQPRSWASTTTTTAGTQTGIPAGPGVTSAARPVPLKSDFARTCIAQLFKRLRSEPALGRKVRDTLQLTTKKEKPDWSCGSGATTSQAAPTSTTEPEEPSEEVSDDQEVQAFPPADALPARSEAAAVQPVIGISQRVRMSSKEKKDLGTLGSVLGITMMVIIIAIGAGIVLGYTYKRGKDLKEQHEQKVCERELQRITLPLSAFTNPTCEIVDEKTIVVHTNQTPVDPQEGSTPLMGQAGTPGA